METRSDFSFKLLATLNAYATHDEPAVFMKAALALCAWYRHEALIHRPELVVQQSADVFEVYGDVRIERQPDGRLRLFANGRQDPGTFVEVSSIGAWLARNARQRVQADFLAKAQELVREEGFDAGQTALLLAKLTSVNEHLAYKLNVNWWRRKCTLADDSRVLGKLLWDTGLLDRDVFGLAVRVGGFRFTVDVFNACVLNRVALAARIKEAPHMAPWLLVENYSARTLQVQETVWKDLKDQFRVYGGTPQAWKWVCNQGYSWFRYCQFNEHAVALITRLAALQLGKVPLHMSFVGRLRSICAYDYQNDADRYLEVYKAAVVAHKKRKLKVADFSDFTLIFDYLQRVPAAATKGATWASLMRKQHAWHMEFARAEMARRKEAGGCVSWAPYVQSLGQGSLEAISVNNSDDLWEEGTVMDHCVGGYDQQCYQNISRIYSIRREGERVATLEIRRDEGKLSIGQLYGFGNKRITDASVNTFAKKVLAACKRVPEPDRADNKVIRQPNDPARRQALAAPAPAHECNQELAEPMDIPF